MVNDIIDRYGVENVRAALERHTGNKLPTGGYLQQYNAANHNLPPTKVPWDSAYVQESIRANRQRYAESAFKDAAKSPAGAVGAWQIMPITKRDYLTRGKGKD
ncbi:MAG: transglycosylase SLT domain-containing protein, partial [Bacteroidales bacterium]|nr:transglycosylase SLT domain-containing protein [Bacteroidales bacterium]